MGITPSCIPLAPVAGGSSSSSSTACKIIHVDGTVTRLARPVRASELMVDYPGQFVCDSGRLAVGCRVPGVAADELLEPRRAYFLLPMDMLYSVLTDEEMAALSSFHVATAAMSSWKRIATGRRSNGSHGRSSEPTDHDDDDSDGAKFFPVLSLQLQAAPDAATAGVKSSGGAGMRRQYRTWQPKLDAIDEVP
ncbi:hypothetical protein E2562_023516 [Oryza meyeriana var. granulata]|uniref:DUF4228 domain-containing protein n=1 Tax=Oryza meyeriana var. granulata TaxID=110450 RepID=A0A6G1DZP5_9ORYZ|nr:hypothetical protein E2562_023516 [Oryza meyeriana var. granulata]